MGSTQGLKSLIAKACICVTHVSASRNLGSTVNDSSCIQDLKLVLVETPSLQVVSRQMTVCFGRFGVLLSRGNNHPDSEDPPLSLCYSVGVAMHQPCVGILRAQPRSVVPAEGWNTTGDDATVARFGALVLC